MLKSKFFTVGIIALALIMITAFVRTREPIKNLGAEINHLDQKMAEAKQKNDDLSKQASDSLNESYIERQLRLKLNYKKADEEAVLIYKTEPKAKSEDNSNFLSKEYKKLSDWLSSIF